VVGPKLELPTFESGAEVLDTCDGSKQFSIKGGVIYLSFGELFAEET
jgi:hypothetical protein